VSPEELTNGRGGKGLGRSHIIRRRESLVLYKILSEKRVQSSVMRKLRIYLVNSLRVLLHVKNMNQITKRFLSPCVFKA
jgi:hypothetical protein